ncbi:methylated-DNA--[protein]-cysteine S-methyltransferase [Chloroflexota bacterium]
MQRYTIVATGFGWMGIAGSEKGLSFLTLPQLSRRIALSALEGILENAVEDAEAFADLPSILKRYFDGERISFSSDIDLSDATSFQSDVWMATMAIPYGETRNYSWIARQIGRSKAWRAVGSALSKNPLPIVVPCHRVIAVNGGLGGFGGGLEMKRRLLSLEGVQIANL